MDQQFQRPSRRVPKWRVAVLSAALLAVAAAVALNRFTLTLSLTGEQEMNLEYGEHYQEPGVQATLIGTYFCKGGIPLGLHVDTHGSVDETRLGKSSLTYSARFLFWSASAQRTVRLVDTKGPIITLTPDDPEKMQPGMVYEEAGYQATDNFDGDITDQVLRIEEPGLVTYTVLDSSGNPAYAQREIPIPDITPPVITLVGGEAVTTGAGIPFQDPGYSALDDFDGDLSDAITVEGEVNVMVPGEYQLKYTVRDRRGNESQAVRRVTVGTVPVTPTVSPEGKVIYLTFDDGPGPYTAELLDVLAKHDVKATFFVVGSVKNGDLLRRMVQEGHSVGIHTMCHNYKKIYQNAEAFFQDLLGEQELIHQQTGVWTRLMRFPGGSSNTISRKYCKGIMTTLTGAVQDAGFRYFDWNVDSDDAGSARTPEEVFNNVTQGVQQRRISVVLQHDIHDYSVDAVEEIILWAQDNGYRFLPLEEDSPMAHHGVNN